MRGQIIAAPVRVVDFAVPFLSLSAPYTGGDFLQPFWPIQDLRVFHSQFRFTTFFFILREVPKNQGFTIGTVLDYKIMKR